MDRHPNSSELVFDQSIGYIFVTRVAGNVVTPELIGSLEFGAAVLGTKVILVMGHSGCGAVKATIQGEEVPGQISSLFPPHPACGGSSWPRPYSSDKGQRAARRQRRHEDNAQESPEEIQLLIHIRLLPQLISQFSTPEDRQELVIISRQYPAS